MKFITRNYKDLLLIFIFSICFIGLSSAQAQEDTAMSRYDLMHIAYDTLPSWMVTSSISAISGTELEKPFSSNFANTLYGRIPGLTVIQGSGEAGDDSPAMYARGLGTFGTGRDLLILVDGFEHRFEQLIPEEVESVTLLRDASASAIFGSRGANGVLLVTTRKGKEGPLEVNFNAQYGFESALRLPDFLGSYDYARLYNEALENDGLPAQYTSEDLAAYQSGSDPYFHPDVDWYDEALRKTAPISEYSLNFRGGMERARYFVNLGVLNRSGLYKKTEDLSEYTNDSKYSQYRIRANVDVDITESMLAEARLGMTIADKSNPAGYTTASQFELMSSVPPNAFPVFNPNGSYGGNRLYSNPWGDMLESGLYSWNNRVFTSNLRLTQQLDAIAQGLSASAAVSFNNTFRGYSSKSREYTRYIISKDASGETVYESIGETTKLDASEGEGNLWRSFTFQSFLNFRRSFGSNNVNAMLRYNLDTYTLPGFGLPFKHVGLSGRFIYANSEKYIGEFSFGYNGHNRYAEGERFGFFPAVSVAWIASNEEFLQGNGIINYLKIRGSYGMAGNDNIGGDRWMYNQYYSWAPGYHYGRDNIGISGYEEGRIANPDVTWEKEKEINIGFEAVVLDRLEIGLDLFKQNRYDILAEPNRTTPQFMGLTMPYLNVGEVDNQGFEAMVGYNGNLAGDLQFFVDLNVWYARNEIVYNAEAVQKDEYLNKTGRSIDQPFLLEQVGFFKDQADIDGWENQVFSEVKPGDLKYKDQNDDGVIDQNDYYPIGYPSIPELTFGLHPGLRYKRLYLDLFIHAVTNYSVYLEGYDFYAFQMNGKISSMALDRWTPQTHETADYPRLSAQDNYNNFEPSSFWQRNGSYIKLRYIELGFDLPERIAETVLLSNARVYINGTNLFSLDYVDIADPENLSGYPSVRSYSIGARIQF